MSHFIANHSLGGIWQHGSLWDAAYHIIHPDVRANVAESEDHCCDGCDTFNNRPELNEPVKGMFVVNDDGSINMSETTNSQDLLNWQDPHNPRPILDDLGNEASIYGGLSYSEECPSAVQCWDPGCDPCNLELAENGLPVPATVEKAVASLPGYKDVFPEFITSGVCASTFNLWSYMDENGQLPDINNPNLRPFFQMATRNLKRNRSKALEQAITCGCNTQNCFFSDTDDDGEPLAYVLGGRNALPAKQAMALLTSAMSECNSGEAGMIHLPSVAMTDCEGVLFSQDIDYGDGMGCRHIMRTKNRGHIVTSGSGYCNVGPGEEPPVLEEGEAPPPTDEVWVYGTPMVHLAWDCIRWVVDTEQGSSDNGLILPDDYNGNIDAKTNTLFTIVEQNVWPLYDPSCCMFAVKMKLCY